MSESTTSPLRRRLLTGGAASIAVAGAPFVSRMAHAQTLPIKIGFPTPLTGAFSAEA
ncbi:MAG TPA: ABC transporter substrate-binding protein, partial [Casimicrobium sp.]|nr:ABC transporter substrate-binding protein [Casimicrobium sp.]